MSPDDTPDAQKVDALIHELQNLIYELRYYEAQAPIVEVASEEGIAYCPTCGAIIRMVPRHDGYHQVVDADGRRHYCRRYIAAVFARANVAGMRELRNSYLSNPIIAAPLGPDGRPPRRPSTSPRLAPQAEPRLWEIEDE